MYSETAAQNYPDPELFQKLNDLLPAKRCGTTAEVRTNYLMWPDMYVAARANAILHLMANVCPLTNVLSPLTITSNDHHTLPSRPRNVSKQVTLPRKRLQTQKKKHSNVL